MKVGDKVVCVKEGEWTPLDTEEPRPVKGDICEIVEIEPDAKGDYLVLKGFPDNISWWSIWFRPLDYDFVHKVISQVQPQSVPA